MPVKVNFRHSSIKKVICCLSEIQIRLGVLYFYLRNPATLFLLTASSSLKESLREFCFIFSSQRLRMCFLAVQQTAHPPLTKLFSFSQLPRIFPVMHILTSCYRTPTLQQDTRRRDGRSSFHTRRSSAHDPMPHTFPQPTGSEVLFCIMKQSPLNMLSPRVTYRALIHGRGKSRAPFGSNFLWSMIHKIAKSPGQSVHEPQTECVPPDSASLVPVLYQARPTLLQHRNRGPVELSEPVTTTASLVTCRAFTAFSVKPQVIWGWQRAGSAHVLPSHRLTRAGSLKAILASL